MAARGLFLVSILVLSCFADTCYGAGKQISFSSLKRTLVVSASHRQGLLKAGEDKITVKWGLNQSSPAGTDSDYETVKVMLCYSPISQVDRAWRKTEDHLNKDKTCQFKIVKRPYGNSNNNNQTFEWVIERDVPTGTYFVRAYALNAHEDQVAYGQNTNANKTTNLFKVQAITGRHVSIDIASVCFSAFSVVSLFFFFFLEKRKAKKSGQ